MSTPLQLPRWIDLGLLPLWNLAIGIGYTLYYATTFVFTGLAVAVAFHGGLFNIGGEGQAMLGGLGAALVALGLGGCLPAWLLLPLMVLAAMAFGPPGPRCRGRCRPGAAATSSSPPSCSTSSPPTQGGYALRAVGSSPRAAQYAGLSPRHQVLVAMGISGALAGLLAVNELSGVQGKLTLDFVAGAGFTGIAVSLMGRNHPVGIVLASLLFGVLYQGGVEVAFELPGFSREMVVTVQGLIVLFAGAMSMVSAPLFARLYAALKGGRRG
jgi:ABC-type uncharacterized transport system permease subunit